MQNNATIKNIWIFHHYATPPNMNGFTRPYNFGINLKKEGINTTVFSSSYIHLSDINIIKDKSLYDVNNDTEIPFVFINTPSSAKSDLKRVINMVSFYKCLFSVTKDYVREHPKPDLIIASSPHPLTMVAGIKIAKLYGIRCICEVRDFWPEVFFMGGKLKRTSVLGKLLTNGEYWIYRKADAIIFLKEGDVTYITDNKWNSEQGGKIDLKKCYYINNGVDIETFNKQARENRLEDSDLDNGKFNVIYTGAIRPVNDVGNIIDTAALMKNYDNIQFLIYGEGNQLEMLKKRVVDERLKNVKIKGYVDKKYIPYVLNKASVNILNYSQEKYNWSRGNSSNKLFEYMAAGKPIISTVKMGYCPLKKYRCGLSINNNTPGELANAIIEVYKMSDLEYNEMSENAKNGAKDYDYKILTERLITLMENQML